MKCTVTDFVSLNDTKGSLICLQLINRFPPRTAPSTVNRRTVTSQAISLPRGPLKKPVGTVLDARRMATSGARLMIRSGGVVKGQSIRLPHYPNTITAHVVITHLSGVHPGFRTRYIGFGLNVFYSG